MGEKIRTPDLLVRSQRSIQLSYATQYLIITPFGVMPATGIEPVREYKSRRILSPVRLPVPPRRHFSSYLLSGTNRARTYDPLLVRQMLSQLSYDPMGYEIMYLLIQATRKGLEPSTSAVTGRRSNQLSHRAILFGVTFKITYSQLLF